VSEIRHTLGKLYVAFLPCQRAAELTISEFCC